MQRKILGICAALVAFGAFAIVPATGSAAKLTETTTGGVVDTIAAGQKIIGEGTGTTFLKTGPLTLECNENVITGSVHRNSNGIIEGTIEDAWFQGNYFPTDPHTPCRTNTNEKVFVSTNLTTAGTTVTRTVGTGTHWCVVGNALNDNWELFGRNCTKAGNILTLTASIGPLDCYFERTASIPGTFNTSNTHTNVAELTMTGEQVFKTDPTAPVPPHSALCPAEGSLGNAVFALYTDNNTTPTTGIHAVPINKTNPLYISS